MSPGQDRRSCDSDAVVASPAVSCFTGDLTGAAASAAHVNINHHRKTLVVVCIDHRSAHTSAAGAALAAVQPGADRVPLSLHRGVNSHHALTKKTEEVRKRIRS